MGSTQIVRITRHRRASCGLAVGGRPTVGRDAERLAGGKYSVIDNKITPAARGRYRALKMGRRAVTGVNPVVGRRAGRIGRGVFPRARLRLTAA